MTRVPPTALKGLQLELAYDDTLSCVQCGYCLPVCPTYETIGTETHSPRGRIHLVKMMAEGKMADWQLLDDSLNKCLGCRACETACPVGVEYGHILESAAGAIKARKHFSAPEKLGRSLIFRGLFPHKRLLNTLSGMLWAYQKSGMEKAVHKLKLTRVLPKPLATFASILPQQTSPLSRMRRSRNRHSSRPWHRTRLWHRAEPLSPSHGQARYRVAFFTGCIMDAMFERINRLSMDLLAAAGCEVMHIPGETCCGALHAHAGEQRTAKKLAKRNIEAFEKLHTIENIDFVLNNAGGCGAMLTEYPHLFDQVEEAEWHQRAVKFAEKCKDISVVLAQLELPFIQSNERKKHNLKVTYQRSCHMTHVQKVTAPPLELIQAIPGIEFKEMADKDKCCGSAGIYNLVNYEESMAILDVKMQSVKTTAAQAIVTTNPGCLLQMQLGIQREGLQDRMRAVHLVELLAEACGLTAHSE